MSRVLEQRGFDLMRAMTLFSRKISWGISMKWTWPMMSLVCVGKVVIMVGVASNGVWSGDDAFEGDAGEWGKVGDSLLR